MTAIESDENCGDWTLVCQCRQGSGAAFRVLVERYQKKAFGQALAMLKDREEAMDVAQEAFVKVYRRLEHFQGSASFSTWLYRIVFNLCVDRLRRKETTWLDDLREQTQKESAINCGLVSSPTIANPLQSTLQAELAKKINEALAQVPEKQREVLILRELEGLSYEEIARVLQVPKGTVMSRLHHARVKLQELLCEYRANPFPTNLGKKIKD